MQKRVFFSFILNDMLNLTVDQKVRFLNKVKDVWLPELISNETKNYTVCSKCKKHIKNSEYLVEDKRVVNKGECIFRDAGYGEDDEYADVTYLIRYRICPKCRNRVVISKHHLKTENVHTRYD